MYCTLADLIEQYSEQDIILLTDRTNKPASTIDEELVKRAINDASAEIDLHLHARYRLPLVNIPTILKRIASTLAYEKLHRRLPTEHPAFMAAEQVRKLLSGIASGKLSLGLDASGNTATIANTVQISSQRADWGRNNQQDE